MASAVPVTLEISLGPQTYPEELDVHTRRLRRELDDRGLWAELRHVQVPVGTKASAGDQPGQLNVSALPEQFAALMGTVAQWASADAERSATLRQLPPETWGQLAGLVVALAARVPVRLARFTYQDGDRVITLDYDPDRTDPRDLLAEIGSLSSGVSIVAHGDITIGGHVSGHDLHVAALNDQ